jgi:integrase
MHGTRITPILKGRKSEGMEVEGVWRRTAKATYVHRRREHPMATGHVERHGKTWSVIIDYGRKFDPEAKKVKQVRKRLGSKPTKAKGLTWLHDVLAEINKGTYVEPTSLTVKDYLRRWFNERCAPRLAPTTLANYSICNEKHLIPRLGQMRLDKLQPYDVQAMYSAMLADGAHPRTVEQVHQVLHIALSQAVKWQLLARNVTEFVDPPHPKKREISPLSPEELDSLLEAAKGSSLYPLIFLALHTGMRRGELLALKWDCVDLDEAFVRVESNLQKIDGKVILGSPKSTKSRRAIPLDKQTISLLRDMGEHQQGFVFTREGKSLDPSVVTHEFAAIAKSAGFRMRLHDLRHNYASIALLAGVPMKVVQELLGHEDSLTTMNTYSHVLRSLKTDAAKAIGGALESGKHQENTKADTGEGNRGNDCGF